MDAPQRRATCFSVSRSRTSHTSCLARESPFTSNVCLSSLNSKPHLFRSIWGVLSLVINTSGASDHYWEGPVSWSSMANGRRDLGSYPSVVVSPAGDSISKYRVPKGGMGPPGPTRYFGTLTLHGGLMSLDSTSESSSSLPSGSSSSRSTY